MLPADVAIESALTIIDSRRASAALVADTGGLLAGRVTRERLQQAMAEGRGAETIGAIADADLVHVHPDHPVELVLDRFSGSGGMLPVVSRGNTRQVEGVVTLETIASGFDFRQQNEIG
jgi:CBS domain-containing protein